MSVYWNWICLVFEEISHGNVCGSEVIKFCWQWGDSDRSFSIFLLFESDVVDADESIVVWGQFVAANLAIGRMIFCHLSE